MRACVRAYVRVSVCVCVCVVGVIVKRPVLAPSVVDGRSKNPLYYYYYYFIIIIIVIIIITCLSSYTRRRKRSCIIVSLFFVALVSTFPQICSILSTSPLILRFVAFSDPSTRLNSPAPGYLTETPVSK